MRIASKQSMFKPIADTVLQIKKKLKRDSTNQKILFALTADTLPKSCFSTQQTLTCSKSNTETLERGVKYVQS